MRPTMWNPLVLMRKETEAGGFCMAVPAAHCPKLKELVNNPWLKPWACGE